jgi:hypothetical protein
MLRVLDIAPCTWRCIGTRRVNHGHVSRMSQANEYVSLYMLVIMINTANRSPAFKIPEIKFLQVSAAASKSRHPSDVLVLKT